MNDLLELPRSHRFLEPSPIPLQRDTQAESKAPLILRGIPYYGLEEILFRHELEAPFGQFKSDGFEGIGFILKYDPQLSPEFLKIYKENDIPSEILKEFLQRMHVRRKNYNTVSGEPITQDHLKHKLTSIVTPGGFWPIITTENNTETILYRQAAAFRKGHRLYPENIPALHAIWTYQGVPVGLSSNYIEGIDGHVRELQKNPDMIAMVWTLQDNQIEIDIGAQGKNIITKPDGTIMLIDLSYTGDLGEIF